jgi:Mannosyltransferase (PIG-V)
MEEWACSSQRVRAALCRAPVHSQKRSMSSRRLTSVVSDQMLAQQDRTTALRDTWLALWSSRLLVWIVGIASVRLIGVSNVGLQEYDPKGLTRGLGRVGEALAGPAARWDAAWYLVIARDGYQPQLGPHTLARAAFYPAYPLAIRAVSLTGVPLIVAGVLVSLCAFAAALYGIHRLTTLEFARIGRLHDRRPDRIARLAVFATAFAPMAVFFSAVYPEAFFLAFSVALFWCARQGRWMWVGLTGALALATRSNAVVLALPALVIYLYGPREDRVPDKLAPDPRGNGASGVVASLRRAVAALRPRYRLRRDVLWLALFPVGVILFQGALALSGGKVLASLAAEHQVWHREFRGPIIALWDALQHPHVTSFFFLMLAIPAVVGVLRRLPLVYGLYVLAAIAVDISYPANEDPLLSLPRFLAVLFPLTMWFGLWLSEHPRMRPLLVLSAFALAVFVERFATWHWAG